MNVSNSRFVTDATPQDEWWSVIYDVAEMLEEKYFDKKDYEICKVECVRINNQISRGLLIKETNRKSGVSPNLYIDEETANNYSIEQIAKHIKLEYEEQRKQMENLSNTMDMSYLIDFNNVKDYIYPMFINKELNKDLGYTTYDIDGFNDVTVIFFADLEEISSGNMRATVKITDKLLNTWKVSLQDIVDISFNNIKSNGYYFDYITRYLITRLELVGKEIPYNLYIELKAEEAEHKNELLYVVTTDKNLNYNDGTIDAYLFRKEISSHIGGDFYCILSSIHEAMIAPPTLIDRITINGMVELVKDINDHNVIKEEFLSNTVYKYDSANDKFEAVN